MKEGDLLEEYDIFLEVEAIPKNLVLVRALVRNYLEVEKINETQSVQLISVVDELVTNVVEHAYKGNDTADKILRVVLRYNKENIEIIVEDFGNGIDKNSKSKEEGGMGLIIVKKVSDHFICVEKNQGVMFKIIKKVEKEEI